MTAHSLLAAYFLVSGNTIANHGSTGFAAGQGTGFEYTVAPWIQYEAYAIKVGWCASRAELGGCFFDHHARSKCMQILLHTSVSVVSLC